MMSGWSNITSSSKTANILSSRSDFVFGDVNLRTAARAFVDVENSYVSLKLTLTPSLRRWARSTVTLKYVNSLILDGSDVLVLICGFNAGDSV